jgi:arabinogalactan endo-1,4-beta-galactosidase
MLVGFGLTCHCSSDSANAPPPSNAGAPANELPSTEMPGASDAPGDTMTPPPAEPAGDDMSMPTDLVGAGGLPAVDPDVPAAGTGGTAGVEEVPAVPVTPPFTGSFILGADISSVQEALSFDPTYVDTDGQEKTIFELLKNHGFNYVRLRTFVDPSAQYGYASGDACQAKAEPYNDRDHTVAFARDVKAAGMGYLLDFHYSDTWADPGKQVIPEAWRDIDTLDVLAEQVRAYTVDVLTAMVAAGARPDMVQVGNEITPGMLIHVPTANTDCYGSNSTVKQGVNGSQNDWDNLAALLRAGIEGVRQVDPTIKIMLHIENTESVQGVSSWVRNAQQRGVEFDVLGLSAYEAFQGPSTAWRGTLTQLAQSFPDLSFAIAEYNPQRRLLNDIMRELPDGRGVGTFFWEPTQSGSWGQAMFTFQGNRVLAIPADFAEYDQMRDDFDL